MMRKASWFALVTCLLVGAAAYAQEASETAASTSAVVARREANVLLINGQPTVLLWARGLADQAELDAYRAAGLNTAYVLIESTSNQALAAASQLVSAAEQRGLFVVAAITPDVLGAEERQPEEQQEEPQEQAEEEVAAESYASAVGSAVQALVQGLQDHPRLIGWSIEAVDPAAFPWSDDDLRARLRDWYDDSLFRLNASWGTWFQDWEEITLAGVRDVDALYPAGLGRASVDLAYYCEASYADALATWARALRAADPERLILASSLPDYRSLISVPDDFDGLVLNTYPTVAEADWQTHNIHAVDIARRGNRFAAIPTFWVDSNLDPIRTGAWMNEALLHGATGLAFSSWAAVQGSEALQQLIQQSAEALRTTEAFPATPLARAAIIYQPIAGGAVRDGRGLYGYLDGVTPDEPTNLFAVARRGSRYGQFDVLATSTITQADLQQYGTIFAPMAFFLPEDAQVALHGFVLRGGALLVDAGVGMYQAGGTVDSMPPMLNELLGMRYAGIVGEEQPSELGSVGQPGQPGQPGVAVPVGPGEAGLAIDPDVARFADYLSQFLDRPDVRRYLGEEFIGEEGPGFRVRGLGGGYAVYAPTFLYASWAPTDPFFVEFHDRLLSWHRDLTVVQPAGLWPSVGAALYADWSVGLSSPAGMGAVIAISGARNQMYLVPLGAMRAGNPVEEELIELLFPGEFLAIAQPVPVYLRTFEPGAIATASLVRYDAGGIELLVHGAGAEANVTRNGVALVGGSPTNIGIEIRDGAYPVATGSMHHVSVQEGLRGRPREQDMMPDLDTGVLTIQVAVGQARVTIAPVLETSLGGEQPVPDEETPEEESPEEESL